MAPWVPIIEERVLELAEMVQPGLQKLPVIIDADMLTGAALLANPSCNVLSPPEPVHAVLFKIEQRLNAGCDSNECAQWKRTLLSYPAVFKRLDSEDAKVAEHNSFRQDYMAAARAVALTARQMIYNVQGFKTRKEKGTTLSYGADKLHKFWQENVRISAGETHLRKKTPLTLA